MKPLVSIIVPTYNRAHVVGRTIDSILGQTYDHFEIIVVEDGSVDDTKSVLEKYTNSRIRVVFHEVNKGVTAAKNTGLNHIRGEWFTILDSDDEIIPEALETLMKVPMELDTSVTSVFCNCKDTANGEFSGKGLDADQYIDFKKIISGTSGEFWGLTKTTLLMNERFNEKVGGFENVLWFKINERAHIYYVHKALRIYHTEGDDRILKTPLSISKQSGNYAALINETHYHESMKTFLPGLFANNCLSAVLYLSADKQKEKARFYYNQLNKIKGYHFYKLVSFFFYHSNAFFATIGIRSFKALKIIS